MSAPSKSPRAGAVGASPRPKSPRPTKAEQAAAAAAAKALATATAAVAAATPAVAPPAFPNSAVAVGAPIAVVPNAMLVSSVTPAPVALALDAEEAPAADAAAPNAAKDYICLVSKDGHRFIVNRDAALASGTIRTIITGPGQWKEKSEPMTTVIFEAISTPVLEKVIQYFYYKKQYDGTTAALPPFKLEMDSVVPLLLAANFLDT